MSKVEKLFEIIELDKFFCIFLIFLFFGTNSHHQKLGLIIQRFCFFFFHLDV